MPVFLDPSDRTPQVLFHRKRVVAKDGLPCIEHDPVVIRFRNDADADYAAKHNEQSFRQFAGMNSPDFPPFISIDGTIKTVYRWLLERRERRVPRYPCK